MYQVRETSMTIAVRLRATVDERVRACQRCFRLFGRIISEDVTGRRAGRGEGGKIALKATEFAPSWNYCLHAKVDEMIVRLKSERKSVEFLCKLEDCFNLYTSSIQDWIF